ncbi:hypothetical protein VKT23_013293 [Stygiomarasmius scandens]|uniref:Uncharacterized protein n=1 Tax=Marasmiellus scandens TaxID=2682957 RepID=A0ABR1J8S8_9AGAR
MATSSRKITFAPLPIPRRQVLITDDGVELPLTPDPDSKFDLNVHQDGPVCIPAYFSLQAISAPKPSSPSPSSAVSGSATSESSNHSSSSSSSSSSASSMHSLTPTQSIEPNGSITPTQSTHASRSSRRKSSDLLSKIASKKLSAEQILTLGAINLFRSNKGKNKVIHDDLPPSSWGGALTRWSSGGSAPNTFGAPLARTGSTQSTQTYKRGNVRKPRSADNKNAARANGLISTLHNDSNKGRNNRTRMLNGRVYGARRNNVNHFASARDDEPEFVEWGYGGMGSVKNHAVGGSLWKGVMSDGTGLYGQANQGAATTDGVVDPSQEAKRAAADEDDGSGMGWVKRRKEQREREKKEREEKERLEKEQREREKKEREEKERLEKEQAEAADKEKTDEEAKPVVVDEKGQEIGEEGSPSQKENTEPNSVLEDGMEAGHRPTPLDLSTSSAFQSRKPQHRHSHDSASILSRPSLTNAVSAPMSILASNSQDSTSHNATRSAPTSPSLDATAAAASHGLGALGAGAGSVPTSGMTTAHASPFASGMTTGVSTPIEDEHVTRIQSVPYKHRHHHHHSHSRGKSLDLTKEKEKEEKEEEKETVEASSPVSEVAPSLKKDHDDVDADAALAEGEVDLATSTASMSTQPTIGSSSTSSSSIHSSSSGSGSPSESESESDEDDLDEEEEEDDEQVRKTSLGAGVEKISRHK